MAEREKEPDAGHKLDRAHAVTPPNQATAAVPVQELTGDGATGANRAYGNTPGNQGMVVREREERRP